MLITLELLALSFIISIFLQLVGFIWYGPLFGKLYISLAHPNRSIEAPPSNIYILNFIYTWLSVVITGLLFSTQFINSTLDVLKFASLIAIIIGLFRGIHDLFDDRPLALNILHSSYNFILISISTFVLFGTGLLHEFQ